MIPNLFPSLAMNRLFLFLLVIVVSFPLSDTTTAGECHAQQAPNFPIAHDTLRLLTIGNSYSLDATVCLPQLLNDAGVDNRQFAVYCAMEGGASLEYWRDQLRNKRKVDNLYHMGGMLKLPERDWTLEELLGQPWDVIVLQQASKLSDHFANYVPHAEELLEAIHRLCPNKAVRVAWHMTWSHAIFFDNGPYSKKGWEDIAAATRRLCETHNFSLLIPSGTAIQNMRNLYPDDLRAFTRDGTHIVYGMGNYLLALTWFETICSPIFGISLIGVPPSQKVCDINADKTPLCDINSANYPIAHYCVWQAIHNPYELISTIRNKSVNRLLHYSGGLPTVPIYDLSGRPVTGRPGKGIFIMGNKKVVF